MAVVLATLLDEQQVTLDLRAANPDDALGEIVGTMSKLREPEKFLAEVRQRETSQTTYVGNGVAFPHARTELVEKILLGIGRSRAGIPFGEQGELAHLLFLIAVPKRLVNDYLVCVGALARLTKDKEMRTKLLSAATATEFVQLLREASLLLE
jgi:mannitol/fructose-specific phosphotransferase system IIA component (Ntr-type)